MEAKKALVVVPSEDHKDQFVDITKYLQLPQLEAAKKVQLTPSTFSRRWKEAARSRKWPYRTLRKLDNEITTLLHNIPFEPDITPLPPDVETYLGVLLRKRQLLLHPVVIRI